MEKVPFTREVKTDGVGGLGPQVVNGKITLKLSTHKREREKVSVGVTSKRRLFPFITLVY